MVLLNEDEVIKLVKTLGSVYGYGNLINHLKDAWSTSLMKDFNFDQISADLAGGHICPWCFIDERSGKKVEELPR